MEKMKTAIKAYWENGAYMPLKSYTINDFCRLWASEEGFELPEDFSVTAHNSPLFSKMNAEKHAMNLILSKFNYPIIETESLPMDETCAIMRATQLYEQHGGGVIRANRMAGGGGTFIISQPKSIPMMIRTLLHNPKGPILPLFSPYYEFPVEYGVFEVNGKIELVIAKELNEETGLHNLSLGAKAHVVQDPFILEAIADVTTGLSSLFGTNFVRWDIAHTKDGLKIVEGSVPNFKKFSLQDETCYQMGKQLFLTYYHTFYSTK